MTASDDIRRKRLLFRSWHRGTKELDLLLGNFAERHLAAMSEAQLERYENLLQEVPEPQLYAWMLGREQPSRAYDHDVMDLLRNFKIKPQTH